MSGQRGRRARRQDEPEGGRGADELRHAVSAGQEGLAVRAPHAPEEGRRGEWRAAAAVACLQFEEVDGSTDWARRDSLWKISGV